MGEDEEEGLFRSRGGGKLMKAEVRVSPPVFLRPIATACRAVRTVPAGRKVARQTKRNSFDFHLTMTTPSAPVTSCKIWLVVRDHCKACYSAISTCPSGVDVATEPNSDASLSSTTCPL